MVAPDALDLLTYGLQELQGYTDRMHKAVERFRTTGTLPERTFSDLPGPSDSQNGAAKPAAKQTAKQVRAAKAAAAEANGKKPRGLSAFNWYVKAKIAEMKAAGVIPEAEEGKTVNFMTMASAKWKDLGAQGQADFASNFKVAYSVALSVPNHIVSHEQHSVTLNDCANSKKSVCLCSCMLMIWLAQRCTASQSTSE